jgi:hypothetical protein
MEQNERKLVTVLLNNVRHKSLPEAVSMMWRQGLLNKSALERLYITSEVEHRVRNGETKSRAIEHLSKEMSCSYEKVRAVVYNKKLAQGIK